MNDDPTHANVTAGDIASAALAATALPTDADTAGAMAQLADAAGQASTALYNYRRNNPGAPDVERAMNLEMTLDLRAIDLRVKAVKLLGAQAAEALSRMKDAAGRVDDFFATVAKIEGQLTLANALIGLAAAALVGDAGGILGAVVGVESAVKDVEGKSQN